MKTDTKKARKDWLDWLKKYGAAHFLDTFQKYAADAQSTCQNCHEHIYLDLLEGGGVADWRTEDGDYGCAQSPDTCEDGTGSHDPVKLKEAAQ